VEEDKPKVKEEKASEADTEEVEEEEKGDKEAKGAVQEEEEEEESTKQAIQPEEEAKPPASTSSVRTRAKRKAAEAVAQSPSKPAPATSPSKKLKSPTGLQSKKGAEASERNTRPGKSPLPYMRSLLLPKRKQKLLILIFYKNSYGIFFWVQG